MTEWVKNNRGILIPKLQAGFIQPGMSMFNKKPSGGGSPGGPAQPFDISAKGPNISLSPDAFTATSGVSAWQSVRSITSHIAGKWYAECVMNIQNNGGFIFGVCNAAMTYANKYPGQDVNGWGTQAGNTTGARTYNSGATHAYPNFIPIGGSARVAVDFNAGRIWFGDSYNGGRWYVGDPSTDITPAYTFTPSTLVYVALGLYNGSQGTLKNGDGQNVCPIPTGFSMWN